VLLALCHTHLEACERHRLPTAAVRSTAPASGFAARSERAAIFSARKPRGLANVVESLRKQRAFRFGRVLAQAAVVVRRSRAAAFCKEIRSWQSRVGTHSESSKSSTIV
jgi:hypothetical protein